MTELVEALTKELQKQRLKDVDLPRFVSIPYSSGEGR